MLTLAKIISIQQNSNKCSVHIPLFDVPGTTTKTVLPAVINTVPGTHSGYSIDDTVVVGFVDNATNKPIVIGKLFLGTGQEATNRGLVSCSSLDVSDSMTIPITTKIKFTGEPDTFVATDGGYSSYNSIQDLIDALQKHTQELVRLRKDVTLETDQRFSDVQQVLDRAEELSNTFTNSVAEIKVNIDQDQASINSLVGWKDTTTTTISKISKIATDNQASLDTIVGFVDGGTAKSVVATLQQAEKDSASLETILGFDADGDGQANSVASTLKYVNENQTAIDNWVAFSDGVNIAEVKLSQYATQDYASTQIESTVTNKIGEKITASFIVGAINNQDESSESFVKIKADKLEFNGETLNIKVDATNINGTLTIGEQLPEDLATKSDIPTEAKIVQIADGRITADKIEGLGCNFTTGTIGAWVFDNGVLRSASGFYGVISYHQPDSTIMEATKVSGYIFTVLTATGMEYHVFDTNSYVWGGQKYTIQSFSLGGNITSTGGGGTVQPV